MKDFLLLLGGFILLVVLFLLFGWVFMFLWNETLVDLFSTPTINLRQSIGINALLLIVGSYFHSK